MQFLFDFLGEITMVLLKTVSNLENSGVICRIQLFPLCFSFKKDCKVSFLYYYIYFSNVKLDTVRDSIHYITTLPTSASIRKEIGRMFHIITCSHKHSGKLHKALYTSFQQTIAC